MSIETELQKTNRNLLSILNRDVEHLSRLAKEPIFEDDALEHRAYIYQFIGSDGLPGIPRINSTNFMNGYCTLDGDAAFVPEYFLWYVPSPIGAGGISFRLFDESSGREIGVTNPANSATNLSRYGFCPTYFNLQDNVYFMNTFQLPTQCVFPRNGSFRAQLQLDPGSFVLGSIRMYFAMLGYKVYGA